MANSNPAYPLQQYATGAQDALALKEFGGLVLGAYPTLTTISQFTRKQTITQGQSYQFPATWKSTADYHVAGTTLTGVNEPQVEERIITLDTQELISHVYEDKFTEFVQHYSLRAERAVQAANAIARKIDQFTFATAINGARQVARGTGSVFPAGNLLTTPRTGAAATAYPMTEAGSLLLQADIREIGRKMREKDCPVSMGVCFLSPYLHDVLIMDTKLSSRDWQGGQNDLLKGRVTMCSGFMIMQSNLIPSTAVTGSLNSNYDGDFSLTKAVLIGDISSAIGEISYGGITPFGPDWIPANRAHLLGASILQGRKWLRPEALGEITTTVTG